MGFNLNISQMNEALGAGGLGDEKEVGRIGESTAAEAAVRV